MSKPEQFTEVECDECREEERARIDEEGRLVPPLRWRWVWYQCNWGNGITHKLHCEVCHERLTKKQRNPPTAAVRKKALKDVPQYARFAAVMTRPCIYCRPTPTERNPCAEGADRCEACLKRANGVVRAVLAAHGIVLPSPEAVAKDNLTIGVGLEKRNGVFVVAGHPRGEEQADTIAIGSVVDGD